MSDKRTIARPYARAIFKHAQQYKALERWSTYLWDLAQAMRDPVAVKFIENPTATVAQKTALLVSVVKGIGKGQRVETLEHFVSLLAEHDRLAVMPDIYAQFESLRALAEQRLTVYVTSAAPLTEEQKQRLTAMLSRRFGRQVTLEITIEPSLLGGALIRAEDLVIDGTVRSKLTKLGARLAI